MLSCVAFFCNTSPGQRRKADTKNRQYSLQDPLCAIATRRQQDKAVSCLDTSLAPLPAALTWHRVDCGPPAGTGSSLQWSFSHWEIHTYTHTTCDRTALKTTGETQCYKTHLFYRRFKVLPSQAFPWIFALVVKADLFKCSPQQKHLKLGRDGWGNRIRLAFLLTLWSFFFYISSVNVGRRVGNTKTKGLAEPRRNNQCREKSHLFWATKLNSSSKFWQ